MYLYATYGTGGLWLFLRIDLLAVWADQVPLTARTVDVLPGRRTGSGVLDVVVQRPATVRHLPLAVLAGDAAEQALLQLVSEGRCALATRGGQATAHRS